MQTIQGRARFTQGTRRAHGMTWTDIKKSANVSAQASLLLFPLFLLEHLWKSLCYLPLCYLSLWSTCENLLLFTLFLLKHLWTTLFSISYFLFWHSLSGSVVCLRSFWFTPAFQRVELMEQVVRTDTLDNGNSDWNAGGLELHRCHCAKKHWLSHCAKNNRLAPSFAFAQSSW